MYSHRRWLEAGNFRFIKSGNHTIRVAKTKALISFAVTAPLFWQMQNVGFLMTGLKLPLPISLYQ